MDDFLTGPSGINRDIEKQLASIEQVNRTSRPVMMQPPPPMMSTVVDPFAQQPAYPGYASAGYAPQYHHNAYPYAVGHPQQPYAMGGHQQQYPAAAAAAAQPQYLTPPPVQQQYAPPPQPQQAPQYAPPPAQQQQQQQRQFAAQQQPQPPQYSTQPSPPKQQQQQQQQQYAPQQAPPLQQQQQAYAAAPAQIIRADPPPARQEAQMRSAQGGRKVETGDLLLGAEHAFAPADLEDHEEAPNEELEVQRHDLETYHVIFETEVKLGMLLERRVDQAAKDEESTIVTMVIEGGAAARKGVAIGSRLLAINDTDTTSLPYAKCLDMVKSLPRPLRLVFERSRAACDTAKGWILLRKSAGSAPPSSMSQWKRAYFVVGGAVAKRHVLQLYDSKQLYEEIVVRMFQGQHLSGLKYKAYALTANFKTSDILTKSYKSTGDIKYFTLRNPYSRTKIMKFASENPSILHAFHSHVTKYATLVT